ncbi:MAG: DUF2142 domain-containing protein [Saprospiraceae bacterium]|nr:DUF2142 domain-containing protein [Saprospiraceae bacterium]
MVWKKSPIASCLVILWVGLAYVFLIPPFQAPDETNHFLKAWSVSQGHVFLAPTVDHRLGDTLPLSLTTLCTHFRPTKDPLDQNWHFQQIREGLNIPLAPEKRQFQDFANTGFYAPFAYAPAALSILLIRWLEAPPLTALYLARLTHLLLWLLCLFLITKQAYKQRYLFLFIGLLPGILVFQCSLNPDAVVHVASWVLILQLLYGKAHHRWQWAGPLLLLASIQKLILFPLGLIKPFRADRSKLIGWLAAALILVAGWSLWSSQTFIPYRDYHPQYRDSQTLNPGVYPSDQLAFIRQHPFVFLNAAMSGILRSAPATTAHWLGKYGWEKHYLPVPIMLLLFGGLMLVCLNTAGPPGWRKRLHLVVVSVVIIFLFALTNCLLWDPVGATMMDNFQGRYFIPVLPLVFWAGSSKALKGEIWLKIVAFCLVLGHLSMIFLLLKSLFS